MCLSFNITFLVPFFFPAFSPIFSIPSNINKYPAVEGDLNVYGGRWPGTAVHWKPSTCSCCYEYIHDPSTLICLPRSASPPLHISRRLFVSFLLFFSAGLREFRNNKVVQICDVKDGNIFDGAIGAGGVASGGGEAGW